MSSELITSNKILIISPCAGMANKFRTLASGILLGRVTNRTVYYCWNFNVVDDMEHVKQIQSVHLTNLFDSNYLIPEYTGNPQIDIVFTEWLENTYWYNKQSSAQKNYAQGVQKVQISNDATDILNCDKDVILLETSLCVYLPFYKDIINQLMTEVYIKHFKPVDKYLNLLSVYDNTYISVFIRRGDLLWYFPEANQSYDDILNWLTRFDKDRLMILSNDIDFRNNLRSALSTINNIDDITKDLPMWELGFIEFLFIGLKSTQIYGTPMSSFHHQAAVFRGVPYANILS